MSQKLSGVIAAIATPIEESGAPDTARATKLARYLLDNGCDALNVLGTTGEATSFSLDERMRVMSAYKAAGLPMGRLMVGTGAAAVADAVALTRHAAALGFAAALLLPPFYYKGVPDDGLVAYIDAIVKATADQPIPIYLYHFPAHVGPAVACGADPPPARGLFLAHRRIEGLLRRHGLRALGGGGIARLRRLPVDRSLPHRGTNAAISPAASRQPPISTPICVRAPGATATQPRSTKRSPSANCSTDGRWSPASRRCSLIFMVIRRWRG